MSRLLATRSGSSSSPSARPELARVLAVSALLVFAAASPALAAYYNFEAGQVRPLALSPDGSRLFAVNTPDNHLAIYDVNGTGLYHAADVPVGLRPVALAVRDDGGTLEVWVVNHLSDSVSIVRVDNGDPRLSRVVKTLHVGDEPRDIVFGGTSGQYAFITTARRGQGANVPAANFQSSGTPRALVWVFDVASPGAGIGGTPINIIELMADTPRGLAVNATGSTVYAAAFRSGNGTTALFEDIVAGGGPNPPPGHTPNEPETGLIVKNVPGTGIFLDEDGTDWGGDVPFSLPDDDVFLIDATASPPVLQSGSNSVAQVGTILFNMAVRPNGTVYVSNLDFRNEVRFLGMGPGEGLQGNINRNRITVINGTTPTAVHLNDIDYSVPTGPQFEIDQSLSMPMDMVFNDSGSTVFVAAFGSAKVAILDAAQLEGGAVSGDLVSVPGGPSGLAFDGSRARLYVMSRFDNKITVISQPENSSSRSVLDEEVLPTPEPSEVVDGRPFLYDSSFSSGHGDAACGTCHLFGDMDKVAWDLGEPFGATLPNPNPIILTSNPPDFHPMKGPMTTQSLRGLPGQGPLHWRGDKTNAPGPFDVPTNFLGFSPSFVGLLGKAAEPSPAEFQLFSDFVMTLRYPPSPVRPLDDVLVGAELSGQDIFENITTAGP